MDREDRVLALIDATDAVVMGVDEQGTFVEWSRGAEALFGWTRREVVGQHASFFAPPDRKEEMAHNIVRVARGEKVAMETVRLRKDGTAVDVELLLSPVRDPSGALRGMWAVARDLGEERRLQGHVEFLERSFAMLQGIASAARRATDPDELAREACRIAVERGGLRMAWYGRCAPRDGRVVPIAHAGHEEGYLLQSSITSRDEPRGRGPTGRALREKRPVVCSDILHDPTFAPWRDAALARGYRSAASIPLIVHEQAVGTINFYAQDADHFTPSTVRLLASIADVLSLAEERHAEHAGHTGHARESREDGEERDARRGSAAREHRAR